jgi:hypothetical protein
MGRFLFVPIFAAALVQYGYGLKDRAHFARVSLAQIRFSSAYVYLSGVMHSPCVDFSRRVAHNELVVGKSG